MTADANKPYDLAIIGSGSAAFSAAIHAVTQGASVVLVEQGTVGGTCVNVGCVPSKALLAAAEARHIADTQAFPGISTQAGAVDMESLILGKKSLVEELRYEKYENLAKVYGFSILHGTATFNEDGSLLVSHRGSSSQTTEVVFANHYVIATGATPSIPAVPGLESVPYLTSTTAMELSEVPESLVVIGANAVGLEQAQLFSHLGAKVTVIELRSRIAPFEEPEISQVLTEVLEDEGIEILPSSSIEQVSGSAGAIHIELVRSGERRSLDVTTLLVATGRVPNTAGLGLENVGVKVGPHAEVVVDDQLRTSNPKIYAAGDVTGGPQFVYVAGQHGTIAVDNALSGMGRKVDYRTLPRVTFTTPQIASVGLSDEEAVQAGYRCESRVVNLSSVPRAIVNRDTRGLVKIVADSDTKRVLGIHLLANGAADSILAGVYALEANFTVDQLASIWAPYLTMAEAIRLGAQSFGRDVSLLSCCAS